MQVMFALILGVVLYSAMNAVLVAQLAVFDIPFPFKSLDDIANKRTHSLCLRSNSFVYNNFTNQNREIFPRWRGILNVRNCLDITSQENLSAILCNEDLVILENRAVMEMILKNYDLPCEIMSNQERLFQTGNSFLLSKSFKHKKLIDNMVKKMRSTGILQRLEYIWIRREKLENINLPQSPQVTLDHVKGILVMYSAMIVMSLLVLTIENFYSRYSRFREFVK
nr:PREDICTED: uncharacterized protein LOC103315225 [Tribolium castaneum]|eukprot:XP_015840733.1 PREDICTED: uncharacterized protein LOC103315225 [Tribolium castaneum]